MRILLARHGPVALPASGLFSFADFARYVAEYEQSGLVPGAVPPSALREALGDARVFASDAPRVSDTLARLGVTAQTASADWREAPPDAPHLSVPLPVAIWLALARLRGALDPNLSDARAALEQRAQACAGFLCAQAQDGPVALVGHGWFNRSTAQALIRRGWRRSAGPGFARPWGFALFVAAP